MTSITLAPVTVTPKTPRDLTLTLQIDNYNNPVIAKYEKDLAELEYQESLYNDRRSYYQDDCYYNV
jgi:hypothetical protein